MRVRRSDSSTPDARSFLPLGPLPLQVLLALLDEDRHGYGIIREVETRTDGLITLRTGTLYTMLQRLLDQALIETTGRRPARNDDERRRYYRLTALGRDVVAAELARLEALLRRAK